MKFFDFFHKNKKVSLQEKPAPDVAFRCLSMPEDKESREKMISQMVQNADDLYDAIMQRSLRFYRAA